MGDNYRFYRLFFDIFSVATFVPLLMYSRIMRTEPLFTWDGYMHIAQYCLIILAAVLLISGARHYSILNFLGIQQILQKKFRGSLTESGEFDSSGILGVVRHPWYLAVFILLWARDLDPVRIIVGAILSAYLLIGTLLEERKLLLEFGDKYKLYQRQVSMVIPLKWLRSKLLR
jgi:protein-S-isoprenylcysteine O-methyltransferase Ste14